MGKLNKSNGIDKGKKNQGDYTVCIGKIKFFPSSSPLYRFFVGNFFDKFLYICETVKSYKSFEILQGKPIKQIGLGLTTKIIQEYIMVQLINEQDLELRINDYLANSEKKNNELQASIQKQLAELWADTTINIDAKVQKAMELQKVITSTVTTKEQLLSTSIKVYYNAILDVYYSAPKKERTATTKVDRFKAGDVLTLTVSDVVYNDIKVTESGLLDYNGKLYKPSKLHLDAYIEHQKKSNPSFEYKGAGLQGLSSSNFQLKK